MVFQRKAPTAIEMAMAQARSNEIFRLKAEKRSDSYVARRLRLPVVAVEAVIRGSVQGVIAPKEPLRPSVAMLPVTYAAEIVERYVPRYSGIPPIPPTLFDRLVRGYMDSIRAASDEDDGPRDPWEYLEDLLRQFESRQLEVINLRQRIAQQAQHIDVLTGNTEKLQEQSRQWASAYQSLQGELHTLGARFRGELQDRIRGMEVHFERVIQALHAQLSAARANRDEVRRQYEELRLDVRALLHEYDQLQERSNRVTRSNRLMLEVIERYRRRVALFEITEVNALSAHKAKNDDAGLREEAEDTPSE